MSPGTEFARDFCAGIGPLQLGVVLVLLVPESNHVSFFGFSITITRYNYRTSFMTDFSGYLLGMLEVYSCR